ncbi:hypothetical protein Tco_1185934 [Tanacetum coccineum]
MGIGLCNVKGGLTSMGGSGGKSLLDCREWLHGKSSCEDDKVDDSRLVVVRMTQFFISLWWFGVVLELVIANKSEE